MSIEDLLQKLSQEELDRFDNLLKTLKLPSIDDLLVFKIHLEGTKFQSSLHSDLGYAIWKLQQSYYSFVSLALYGDPVVPLSAEEKERFLLNFQIEKGSTVASSDYGDLIPTMIEKVADKMEAWQILTVVVLAIASYAGIRVFETYCDTRKKKQDNDLIANIVKEQAVLVKGAYEAGKEGRTAILKKVPGISKATIGLKEYSSEDIAKIKISRRERSKAVSNICIMHVAVADINSENKKNLVLILKEKDSQNKFKANFEVNFEDDSDNTAALDIIWNSARYEDRYFWAEVLTATRRGEFEKASILNMAEDRSDLEPSEDDDI